MSRQDKATTERNARELRELVKQPDNKMCADCRKNDARWASWNLGVFVCIRCSGIHRSMGTHISKVKSIDLDIWQPEQLANVKKWGNRRANLYWERHLKAGHVPPDHKIESFIRSKYESRRWAMEGPPPPDPAVLDGGAGASVPAPEAQPPPVPKESRPTPTSSAAPPRTAQPQASRHPLLSAAPPAARPTAKPAPQVDLLNADFSDAFSAPPARTAAATAPTAQPTASGGEPPALAPAVTTQPAPVTAATPAQSAPAPQPGAGLFDLDFRPPSQTARPASKKSDIMSLFSSAPPMASVPPPPLSPGIQGGGFGGWGAPPPQQASAPMQGGRLGGMDGFGAQKQRQPDSGLSAGMSGLNMGGNVWASPAPSAPAPAPSHNTSGFSYQQPAAPAAPSTNHFFSTQDVWGAPAGAASSGFSPTGMNGKSEIKDPFGDIWK